MTLPGGTVTFLFTDIEGSTRLWEELGAAMELVVERHDRLLREVVEANGGAVVKGLGDGLMAAFGSADAGALAAAEAQRRLAAEDWQQAKSLRVRMGLHTAEAVPVDGDYHAAGVNRAARLADAAHGGQVLLSATTASLLSGAGDVNTKSLGVHRLRDLSEAVEIHQLVARELEVAFPEPLSLDAVDHNLPPQRTSFVGREDDVAQIAGMLSSCRLVTLTGLGGVGKTRLALQVAADVAIEHRTVRLVELAALARDVDPTTAVRDLLPWPGPGRAVARAEAVAAAVGDRPILVLLDNCEHVLAEVVSLVDVCLARCPSLTVLATSREPLGVVGEHVWSVAPLAVTTEGDDVGPAVRLFLDRARAAGRATFDNAAMAHVQAICGQLDGIPLAVELAATRVPHLAPAEIAERLQARLGLLAARDRTTVARHRTLTAALDWSHDLLNPAARALLRRMAVFARGATVDALEAVAPGGELEVDEVLDVAASLVDRSLVVADDHDGVTRYSLLETVRRYALERLDDAGETDTTRRAHAEWCTALLDDAEAIIRLGRDEQTEVVAALRWAIDARHPLAVRLAGRSWQWWEVAGRPDEGRRFLLDVLSWCDPSPSLDRSAILSGAGQLAFVAGDLDGAAALHRTNIAELEALDAPAQAAQSRNSLGIAHLYKGELDTAEALAARAHADFEATRDVVGAAYARSTLGLVAAARGDVEQAMASLLEGVRLLRIESRPRDAASVLANLGNIVQDRGDLGRAHRFYEGALQLHEQAGDARGVALSLNNLSIVAQQRGDHDHAVEFAERALATFEEIGDAPGAAAAVNNLANFAAEQGQLREALDRYRSAVERFRDLRDGRGTATSLANLADLAVRCGEARLSWRCAIESLAIGRHGSRAAQDSAVRTLHEVAKRCDIAALPETELLSLDDAALDHTLEQLRAVDVPIVAAVDKTGAASELTHRERQVVRLVTQGRSNGEISAELFISERTVESHMNHIRTKLAIDSRTQLVRWAIDRDLG